MTAPLNHGTITIGTSAYQLTAPAGWKRALLKISNNSGSATIYVGDGTVTNSGVTQGFPIAANGKDMFEVTANTPLNVIASASSTSISYIWTAGN